MVRIFIFLAAVFGGLSVAAGAFGSHALRDQLFERSLEVFETAVRYQMYHALALLAVALLLSRTPVFASALVVAGWSFVAGILLFSGSLYVLSLTDLKIFGAVTPLGGVAFMAGWLAVAIAAFNFK